jgi:Chaperone of endosialidase
VASSATITGNITATSGTFTGTVYATSGTFTGTVYASAGTFTGTVTATSGSFTGSIYASSGTVGGFTIGSTYLSGSGSFFLNASSGDATFNSVTLGVSGIYYFSSAGSLSASTVTTSGALSIGTSAFISSGAEVGGNFQVDSLGSVAYNSTNYNIGLFGTGSGGTVAGRMYKTTSVSSKRFKHNIEPFAQRDYLNIVSKLNPVTFNYNANIVDNPEVTAYGLIAEDVQTIPETEELVNIGSDGLAESIAYDRLQWYVIKAISEINDRLAKLEGK